MGSLGNLELAGSLASGGLARPPSSEYQWALLASTLVSVLGCVPIVVYHLRWSCCRVYSNDEAAKLRALEACFGNATLCSVGFVSCVALRPLRPPPSPCASLRSHWSRRAVLAAPSG